MRCLDSVETESGLVVAGARVRSREWLPVLSGFLLGRKCPGVCRWRWLHQRLSLQGVGKRCPGVHSVVLLGSEENPHQRVSCEFSFWQ